MPVPAWLKPDKNFGKDALRFLSLVIILGFVRLLLKSAEKVHGLSDAVNLVGDLWSGFGDFVGALWNGLWDFVFSIFRFLWPSHHTWNQLMFAAVFILVLLGIAVLSLHLFRSIRRQ